MSYTIAKSIKVNKDSTITICGASNNLRPLYWETFTPKSMTLADLLKYLDDHEIQPQKSANNYKWWYIMNYLNSHNLQGEERLRVFSEMATANPHGKYIVKYSGAFICNTRGGKKWGFDGMDGATRYNLYQGTYIAQTLHGELISA